MAKDNSCCFTGHRNLGTEELQRASAAIASLLPKLAAEGITHFYAGGAIGFDLAAAVTVLNQKRLLPELTLTLALPCRNHMNKWRRVDRELFERVMARADEVVYVSESYTRGCMQMRNCYMADRSSVCVCWLVEQRGGTFNTVSYARKKGLRIINLAPEPAGEQLCFDFAPMK